MEDHISEWESRINLLSDHIEELQSHIAYYQNLLEQKEDLISRLTSENSNLKNQIYTLQNQSYTPKNPNTESYLKVNPGVSNTQNDSTIRKRQCPSCGAMGFAIKEVDDKSHILSYVPRRIYAKKRVCTKCRHEF